MDRSNNGKEVRKWYEIGLKQCNEYLAAHREEYAAAKVSPTFVLAESISPSGFKECRGNELFYQQTGSIAWVFGPGMDDSNSYSCPLHHECWFGVLTCDGTFLEDSDSESSRDAAAERHAALQEKFYSDVKYEFVANKLKQSYPTAAEHRHLYYYQREHATNNTAVRAKATDVGGGSQGEGYRYVTSMTPRALQLHMRVVGHEIVVPTVVYTSLVMAGHSVADILIANYTLTIPSTMGAAASSTAAAAAAEGGGGSSFHPTAGRYRLEARLMWFYMGALFDFPPPTQTSLSATVTATAPKLIVGAGWERLGAIFLGGSV